MIVLESSVLKLVSTEIAQNVTIKVPDLFPNRKIWPRLWAKRHQNKVNLVNAVVRFENEFPVVHGFVRKWITNISITCIFNGIHLCQVNNSNRL